jgi:hypothetical protein
MYEAQAEAAFLPSGPTEHSKSCSSPCSISNICALALYVHARLTSSEEQVVLTQPWIQISLPAPQAVLTAYQSAHILSGLHSASIPVYLLLPGKGYIKEKCQVLFGLTGETTKFPTPSLIFSLIKSFTSLPSPKVCLNLINGSRNCIK